MIQISCIFVGFSLTRTPSILGIPHRSSRDFHFRIASRRAEAAALAWPNQVSIEVVKSIPKWRMTYVDIVNHWYIQLLDAWFMIEFPSISRNKCGGFHTWGYPEIINFYGMFPYKPSILGYPHFRKPPYGASKYWYPTIYLGL